MTGGASLIFSDGLERPLASELSVGRDPANDLVLVTKTVSREHARIVCEDGRWYVEDLGSSDNVLPKELRANLISIGLWLLREAEDIRQGRTNNFEGLIEVSQIIRDGIQ